MNPFESQAHREIDADTLLRLACDLARAEKQYRECPVPQKGIAWKIMESAGDRIRTLLQGQDPEAHPEEEKKGDGSRALADAARQNWLMSRPDVQTYDSAGRPVVFLYPPGNASRIPIYGEDYKHARACAETLLRYLSPVPPAEGPAKPAERSEAEQSPQGMVMGDLADALNSLVKSPSPQPKDSGEALREAMRKFEAENVICPKCSTTIPKWKIGWPVVPAASHAAMKKALAGLLERYVNVVCSGDCGNWNPDDDPAVIAARSALSETGEGAK